MTTATVPTATVTPSEDAKRAFLQGYEARCAADAAGAFDRARSTAHRLVDAAETGDLEALAHAAYMAVCDLAFDFTMAGTVLALHHWRHIDPRRIDVITRLGTALRRDRPHPYDPAAMAVVAIDTETPPAFLRTNHAELSWHDREAFMLAVAGLLGRPDALTCLERIPAPLRDEDPALYRWLWDTATVLQAAQNGADHGPMPELPSAAAFRQRMAAPAAVAAPSL